MCVIGIVIVVIIAITAMCISHKRGPIHTRQTPHTVRTVRVHSNGTRTVTTVTHTRTRIRI